MFRPMRRSRQQLPEAETIEILKSGISGVLAVSGDDDYPYAVPLNYVYRDGKLFFHIATEGHKLDGMMRNAKVSFCVIAREDVVQKAFTTLYRSAIAFGHARVVTDDAEKKQALEELIAKYSPDYFTEGLQVIAPGTSGWRRVIIVEVQIEHLTGKASLEIVTGKPWAVENKA